MKNPILYLAGPIAGCTYQEIHEWRNRVTTEWSCLVKDPSQRVMIPGWGVEEARILVSADKQEITDSDILLVYPWKDSPGTSMEIIYACSIPITVIVVWDRLTKPSPWIQVHANHIVAAFEVARKLIETL